VGNYHFEKLFSPDEASALVPTLEILIRRLQMHAGELRTRIADLAVRDPEIERLQLPEIVERHPELRRHASEMADAAHQIESHGCLLKDINLGLVDFPWEIKEDEVVFLCWQSGEPTVSAWHPVESGFMSRQPIPGGTKPYLN
jgi:hypothetical protein